MIGKKKLNIRLLLRKFSYYNIGKIIINFKEWGILMKLCTFYLNDRRFGFNALDVKEVNDELTFNPIKHAPDSVCGYLNIDDHINIILDLRSILGYQDRGINKNNKVIIFKSPVAESFGVLVDKIGCEVEVTPNQIQDRRKNEKPEAVSKAIKERRKAPPEIVKGVCKLNNELMVILESHKLLNTVG